MTFSPETIYKDLMKTVHPDLHPEIKDATHKAQQVNINKNNPVQLRHLAIEWGLVAPTKEDMRSFRKGGQTVSFIRFNIYDGVTFKSSKYSGLHGIVVDISSVKTGEYTGYLSYTIYIPCLQKFIRAKVKPGNSVNSYLSKYNVTDKDMRTAKREWTKHQVKDAKGCSSLADLGLKPNTGYATKNINVVCKVYGLIVNCKVIRTTGVCVVVNYWGRERIVKISNVLKRSS